MNYRFFELTKKAFYGLCLAVTCGGFTSCTDSYDLDDKGNYPSWLGNSVYDELKNPNQEVLTGTFNYYARLIEDLGYSETLAKTGSKTVFPASDEAFERFFKSNSWGVSRYEDLTDAMKKQLLYSSMLDNAILVEMLSNATQNEELTQGLVLKHSTGTSIIDTITHIYGAAGMPANNSYWEKFYDKGIDLVMDNTQPMMVHFTAEHLIANNITTRGENSDFEVITGTPYNDSENSAYIFRNKIIHNDVTCQNGYIHQLENVLVPPGNMAEVIRTSGESNYFSRMLDRFSAPFYDGVTTNNYNDAAILRGASLIDSIYQKRYFSSRSQGGASLTVDPNGADVKILLPYDPGWNAYFSRSGRTRLSDLAAMFVPTDEAMKQYFLPGGSGSFIIDQYGIKDNTEANLAENIDSIPQEIVQAFLDNLMKESFVETVPSKFGDVMDDASDPMGLSLDVLNRNTDGTYDVKIASNGVIYMLNTVFAPNRYVAVSAPALLTDNMRIMNEAIQDGYNGNTTVDLSQNFYAYLLAMGANYAFFIPTDEAFSRFYIDPAFLKHDPTGRTPSRALKFFYNKARKPYVFCSQWRYDPATGEIGDSLGVVNASNFRTQLIDILNYHTVVLANGEVPGTNRFYKTKHGGEIRFDGDQVLSGGQIDNGLPASKVVNVYNQKNGTTYAIDHVIQAPQQSVYGVLSGNSQYEKFMQLCSGFDADYYNDIVVDTLFYFASDRMREKNAVTKKERREGYKLFVSESGHFGLDSDVKFFNSYNYTVYAPDNDAMTLAINRGLPTWNDVVDIYNQYADQFAEERETGQYSEAVTNARNKALAMIEEMNNFVRYHFQDNSVYADNVVETGTYSTACSDTLGIREKLNVSGGNNVLNVTDNRGNNVSVQYNPNSAGTGKMVNQMTRDYVFNAAASNANSIRTSSFAVVHQISTPLNRHKETDRYDSMWQGANARQRLAAFRRLYDSQLYKKY